MTRKEKWQLARYILPRLLAELVATAVVVMYILYIFGIL